MHELLPLRTVPLEIAVWGPVEGRVRERHQLALRHQHDVVAAWNDQLERRFSAAQRALRVDEVAVGAP